MKPNHFLRSFLAIAGSAALTISYTHAGTLYWDGGNVNGGDPAANANGGNGNWDNLLTNWDTLAIAGADSAWTANDTAIFGGTAGTVTLTDSISAGGLQFDTAGYTITGSTLTFGVAGNIVTNANASITSILAGSVAINKTGTGILTLSGANTFSGQLTVQNGTLSIATINSDSANGTLGNNASSVILGNTGAQTGTLQYTGITASSTKKFTLATGGTGAFEVTRGGQILTLSGLIDGSGALTKTGAGILTLSGSNTFTGLTTISAGILRLGATGDATNTPLGTTAAGTVVSTGAALDLNGFTLGTAEALTLNGTGIASGGALTNSSTTTSATYSGLLTLGSASSIVATNASGHIVLSNVGTITGSGFGLTLGGASTASRIDSIIGTGAGTLTKNDSGTWSLTGTNTYTGTTTLNAGTLNLSGAAGSIATSTGLTLNGGGLTLINLNSTEGAIDRVSSAGINSNGGTITYTNTSGVTQTYAETIGSVNLVRGQLNVLETNTMGVGNIQTLTLSGLTRTGGNANTSAVFFGSGGGLGATNVIKVNGIATSTTAGQIVGPWAFTGTPTGGITDYAIYNSDLTNATVAPASTSLSAPTQTGWGSSTTAYRATSTTETLTATRTAAALNYTAGAGSIALGASNFNLETYGILNSGAGLTISTTGTGALTTPTGGGNLYLTTGTAAITVSAPINDNGGAVTLVKSGTGTSAATGTLTLSSTTSNFSGGIVLNAGSLTTSADTNLGLAQSAGGGGITVNGAATWNMGSTITYNRSITINEGGNLTVSAGSTSGTTGALSGNGTLTIGTGTGYFFNSVSNTFTGYVSALGTFGNTFNSLGDSSNRFDGFLTWGTSGAAKTFALRPFTMNGGSGGITNNGTGALTILQNLGVIGAAGAKTFTLGGTYTASANTFAGNITDGPGSVVTFSKTGAANWSLSGTNTYTGTTEITRNTGSTLIFQGIQALSPSTSLITRTQASGGAGANPFYRILDDSATPASRPGVNLSFIIGENGVPANDNRLPFNVFVGNNSTANGGTSSSTQTNSTIQLGDFTFSQGATQTNSALAVTGANGYKLQIANVNVTLAAAYAGNFAAWLNPTTAPLTVTGTVRQTNDAGVGSTTTLQLDGTASGNLISGNILNSAGGRLMNVSKANTSDWTLSGNNTYTGGTTITTGKVLFSGANALPTTGTVAVGANGVLSIADGTARNQTVSALTLTSLGSLSFDWTGSGTGDQLTSTANITPTAASRFAINLNRSGTPGGSVVLLTGGAGSTLSGSSFYLANLTDYTAALTVAPTTVTVGSYASQTALTTIYWVGNKLATTSLAGVDNAWALSDGTKSNWSNGTTAYTATALTPGATANVIFANGQVGKAQQSTVLGSDVTVNSVVIDDSVAVSIAGANGAALTLMSGLTTAGTVAGTPGSAITVTSNAANPTISSKVILGANQTWNVANGKTLTVSGVVAGDFSLTKADAGTLSLSAIPTYTGTTTISAGSLTLAGGVTGGASLIGNSSAITLSQGTTLSLNPSVTGLGNLYTIPAPITLSGGAGTANIRVGGNDVRVNFVGNVTGQSGVAQTLSISQGLQPNGAITNGDRQNILLSGVIANGASGGTVAVSVDFAGSSGVAQNAFVNLSGQNTFTGNLTVTNSRGMNGGTPVAGAWLTIGGERSSLGTIIGTGFLGSGGNYAGTISIGAGAGLTTLSYLSSATQTFSGQITGTGALSMDGAGGTLILSNATNNYSGSTTIAAGTLNVNSTNALGNSSATNTLIFSGGTLQAAAGFTSASTRGVTMTSTGLIDTNSNALGIAGVIAGAGGLTKNGTGTLTLSGSNNFSGLTTVNAGTLNLTNALALQNSPLLTIGSPNVTVTGPTTLTIGGLNGAWGDLATVISSGYTGGVTALTLNPVSGVTVTYGGIIANGGMTLTKTGGGTQILTNANTYTGTTTINGGTLQLGGSGTLSTSSAIINNGTFSINHANAVSQGTDFSGAAITGTGSFVQAGTGTTTLTAANTFTGTTTISAGTLKIGSAGSLGAGSYAGAISNSGSLTYSSSAAQTLSGVISGTGALVKDTDATSTLTLSAVNTFSGTTTVSAGTLALTNNLALQNSALVTTGAGTVTLGTGVTTPTLGGLSGATGDLASVISSGYSGVTALTLNTAVAGPFVYGGVIADGSAPMSLTKTGTGTQALTNTNTYTGATTINGGILNLGNSTATGSLASTVLNLGGGTLSYTRTGTPIQTFTTTNVVAGASTAQSTTGTLKLGDLVRTVGATLNIGSGTLVTTSETNDATGIIGGWATITNNNWAVSAGDSSSITGAAPYYTTTTGGNTAANYAAKNIDIDSSPTISGNINANTIRFNSNSRVLTLAAGDNIFASGGILVNSGVTGAQITGGNLLGSSGGDLIVHGHAALTIASVIKDNGSATALTKSGAGTLTLTNTNIFTGGLVINAGNVTLGTSAVDSLGASGTTVTVNATTNLTTNGNPTLNKSFVLNNGSMLNMTNGANATTISGAVTGTGGIGPINAGGIEQRTVSLTNTANTFTGPIMLNWDAGNNSTIAVNSLSDAAGSGTINMFSNGAAEFMWGGASSGAPIAPLVLNNRQFQISSTTAGANLIIKSGSSAGNFGMTINTDLLVTTAGAKTLSLRNSSTAINTFAGKIVDGPGAVVSVTKDSDTGIWALTGANSYSGVTTISAGTLQISSLANGGLASSIGVSSNAATSLILNGGTLRYTGAAVSTDRLFSVGTSGGTLNASGTGAVNFTNTGFMAFNATTGARTLTLTGTNTGNNTIAAVIGDFGAATALTKTSIGTWVLGGANVNTGATNISGGGTLVLDYTTNNNAKLGSGILTLTSGGGLVLRAGSAFTETVASLTLGTGTAGGNTSISRDTSGTNKIAFGAITRGQSQYATLFLAEDNLATTSSAVVNGILTGGITVGSNWAKVSSGNIIALVPGDYTALPSGATAVTSTVNYQLTGSLTRTAGTTINSLRIESDGNDQTLNLGANNMNPSPLTGTMGNGAGGGILYAGGGNNNYTIAGTGNLSAQNGNQELIINTYQGTLNVQLNLTMGIQGLTKTGAGTLNLSGTGTYSGGTFVNQGVLRLSNSAGAGTTGAITVQNQAALELAVASTSNPKALTITGTGVSNAGALRNVTSNTASYAGAITIGNGGARINSDSSGALTLTGGVITSIFNDVTFGGTGNTTVSTTAIQGAGGLVKDGTGTTTLTFANTYTGATTVNGGTLNLGGSTSTGSLASGVLALGGGTFSYTRTGTNTQAFGATNINAGASAITSVAGNTITLGGLVRGVGGTVDIGTTGTITTSTANVNGIIGGYATFGGTTWAVANGAASAITGLGTYTLTSIAGTTAANYLNNNIDVDSSEGTILGLITPNSLRFNTASATTVTLATGVNVIKSGGILVTSTVDNNLSTITGGTLAGAAGADLSIIQNNTLNGLTIDSIIADNTGATGLTKSGAGTLTLTNTNTYTGATNVNQGTLRINGNQTSATGAVTVASGATLGGTGTIGGATTIQSGGIYSPGASAGTLNQAAGLTIAAGGIFEWENNTLNTLGSAGTNWDVANVTSGSTTISNTASTGSKIKLMFTNAATSFSDSFWNSNQSWNFITGGVTAGNLFDTSNITVFINAVQQGVSNAISGQGAFSTLVSGSNLQLVWSADTPYYNWINGYPSIPVADRDPDDDPDFDGVTNLAEFAFGTDPTSGSSGPNALVYGASVTTPGQPVQTFTITGPTTVDFNAVFGRRTTYVADGLTYTVQFSANNVDWETSAATPVQVATPTLGIEAVKVPYPLFITTPSVQKPTFFRVTVSMP